MAVVRTFEEGLDTLIDKMFCNPTTRSLC